MSYIYVLLVGIAIGCFLTCLLVGKRAVIGTLKMAQDEYDGDTYMYVELDRPYFPTQKYVVLRSDRSRK